MPRCSVCGIEEPVAVAADGKSAESSATPSFSASAKRFTCSTCLSVLNKPISEGRTTIFRHPSSFQVDGKPVLKEVSNSAPDVLRSPEETKPLSERSANAIIKADSSIDTKPPRFFGSCEILSEISRGSFGVVYRAKQPGLDRVVALKVLLAGPHASQEAVDRFHREARAVARLKHPNIVPIYEIGTNGDHHYFTMEFVEGPALSTLIADRQVPISHALDIVESLADAVEAAHRGGVIHRDIKPSNILIDKNGDPHITDFGLAKQVDLDTKYTMSGTTLGTPAYMPPEQARGEINRVDARSDVYAIGAVLYEMLTGQTPFGGRSLLEVVVAVINEPPKPPRQLNPRIHRDVNTIVLKCLEKEPRLRYSSAAELRDDIRRFRSGETIRARPPGIFRLTTSFVRRHILPIAAMIAVTVALGVAYRKSVDAEALKKVNDAQKKKDELDKIKRQPAWKPDWWFPRKRAEDLDEQAARDYVVPTGKDALFDKPTDAIELAPDLIQNPSTNNQTTVPDTKGAIWTSPEDAKFFGDIEAHLNFTLTPEAADAGVRIGIQSAVKDDKKNDNIPYIAEFKGSKMRLIGPKDLYAYTNTGQPLVLEVKAEKNTPPLTSGTYEFSLIREDMRLTVALTRKNAPREADPGYAVEMRLLDPNLTNWVFKYTQLAVRNRPRGMELQSGEVRRKFGGEEQTSFRNFYTGEYSAAETEFQRLTKSDDQQLDPLLKIQAHYRLGLIREIYKSPQTSPRDIVLDNYSIALNLLEGSSTIPKKEALQLKQEIRMRQIVCYAKDGHWRGVSDELARWGNTKISEPLAWELQGVLELALASKDALNITNSALKVFDHIGVPVGSTRLTESAKGLAVLFSLRGTPEDFRNVNTLYQAYPVDDPGFFTKPVESAMGAQNWEMAVNFLSLAASVRKTNQELSSSAGRLVRALVKANRIDDIKLLSRAYPQTDSALADEISKRARAAIQSSGELPDASYDILKSFVAEFAEKPASLSKLDQACEDIAKALVTAGRPLDVIKLHAAIMLPNVRSDPRIVTAFIEAVHALLNVTVENPDVPEQLEKLEKAENEALQLLTYCTEHVDPIQEKLQKLAFNAAQKRAVIDDQKKYLTILRFQEAYPGANLRPLARDILFKLNEARRHEDALEFYARARARFGNSGHTLTPSAIAALENIPKENLETQLGTLREKVHSNFDLQNSDAEDRVWQLEFGDIQLVLSSRANLWDAAKTTYQFIATAQNYEAELTARALLRLAVIAYVDQDFAKKQSALATLSEMQNAPEEYRLAAKYLNSDSTVVSRVESNLRELNPQPLLMTNGEWDLIQGIRIKEEGDAPRAQAFFQEAARKSDAGRAWQSVPASRLLPRRGDRAKPEVKTPQPTPAPVITPASGPESTK